MAAIFQIRRGDSSNTASLANGELYLNSAENAFQLGTSVLGSPIKLLSLNTASFGDIILTGSAYISGNIALGGTITIGDTTSDNVVFNADLSSSIIPDATNTYDLGSTLKVYKNVYATSISGAIAATNGVVSGSSQTIANLPTGTVSGSSQLTNTFDTRYLVTGSVTSSISQLNTFTSSINGHVTDINTWSASVKGHIVDINTKTGSLETKNTTLGTYTASLDTKNTTLGTYTASVSGHIVDINTKTGSFETKFGNIQASTSSLNTFSASVNGHISDINTKTGSLETKWATLQNVTSSILSYTSSLKSAIELTGSSVTILGNLVVKGTQLLVDSTTIQLGDNILELNGTAAANGGLLVKDTTGTSGSLLWDSTNDYWKGGTIGNEEKLLRAGSDSVISGSLTSLNTFSASVNGHISDINTKTGSFETKFVTLGLYTASLDVKNTTLQTLTASMQAQVARLQESTASLNLYTASLDVKNTTLQTLTASMQAQVARLQESTASLNLYTASQDNKNSTLATYTASVSGHIVDINTKTGSFENKFTTLGLYTASLDTKNNTLGLYTASIDTKFTTLQVLTASVQSQISRLQESTASLNTFSSSIIAFYNYFTASHTNLAAQTGGGFSASVDARLDQLEYTASYGNAANTSAQFSAIGIVTGSLQQASASLQLFTASQEAKDIIIGNYTSSMNTFTASVNGHITDINTWSASVKGHIVDINTKTGSFETKFTTLQTLTASISTQVLRIQESTASLNSYTSSNDTTNTTQNTRLTRIEEATASINLTTSSLATTYEARASATKTIFSGSSQVLGGSGVWSGSAQLPPGVVSGSTQVITANSITLGTHTVGSYIQTITGTSNQVTVAGSGLESADVTLSLPQNIHSAATPTFAGLTINGAITATGDITAYYSDKRLKDISGNIDSALDKVNQISGVYYKQNELAETFGYNNYNQQVGVIAQEIQSVLPEAIALAPFDRDENGNSKSGENYLTVHYEKIVPLLIQAIKELSAKIKDLENK